MQKEIRCRKRLERKERNIEREREKNKEDVFEVIENDRKDERWKKQKEIKDQIDYKGYTLVLTYLGIH